MEEVTPKKQKKKNHSPETIQRIHQVLEYLLQGNSVASIKENIMRQWGIKISMANDYISYAKVLMEKSLDEKLEEPLLINIARRYELYNLAVENREYKVAADILDKIDTLRGAFPKVTTKNEVEVSTTPKVQIIKFGENELRF